MTGRSVGHRAPLLWLVLPYLAGLAAGRAGEFSPAGWHLAFALVAIALAVFALKRAPNVWAGALAGAMFLCGLAAYAHARARLAGWENLPPREIRLALRVDRVFAQRDAKKASGLGTVWRADDHVRELRGQRIYFSLTLRKGETVPVRSAVVSAVGVLVALPASPPADTFDGYLAAAGVNFRLNRARTLGWERPAHAYYRFCAESAARFRATLGQGVAEKRPELAALLRAMMLGETHELSDEQRMLFMQSGTMHLFAISGLNIAVIAGSIQAGLLLLRLPRWLQFVIGIGLLWLFVDITGAAPSAVRAFIMAAFLQAAYVFRRPANLLAALVASALVVLLVSPLQLFSASFLMSYGIVTALLVLGLPLGEAWLARTAPWRHVPEVTWHWWQRWIAWAWRGSVGAVAVGIATTLVSLLTSVQFFGLLTPGALLANLVLIPAAGAATLGGFVSLICGLAGFGPGVVLCNHAGALVLFVIEWLVRQSVRMPGAFLPAHFTASWIGPTALAALMLALLVGYATHWDRRAGSWWPPFVIVALVLLFGIRFG
ncbi:MAG TPA: ComEC/Rec2 family competence protein [Opitutaceae bacterium]|nr:ComEC/Rec2 family competence protein [Opitutaceae bacterium]